MQVVSLAQERIKRMLRRVDPSLTDDELSAFMIALVRNIRRTPHGADPTGSGS